MVSAKNALSATLNTLKLATVEPYLFFCLFGYTVRMVTFQSLLMDSACRNLHLFSDEVCSSLDAHKLQKASSIEAANNLYSGVMLLTSLPAVIVAVFVGPWSDRYTRKYPLVLSAAGMMLEAALSAALASFPRVSPVWYVVTALFSGISGGFIMSTSAAFSYMSDVTDERSRPTRYAVLEFSNILAIVLGSVLGGQLFRAGGYAPAMIVAPCSFAVAILYTVVCVRDTKRRPEGVGCSVIMRDLLTVQNIRDSYRTCSRRRPGNTRLQIWLLVWVSFSQKFVDMGTLAVAYPFAVTMYSWDVSDFSNASTAFYLVNAVMVLAVVPALSNRLRLHEAALGLIGILSLVAKMVLTSVAVKEPIFYYAWFGGSLNNAAGIAIRSRLSKLVNKDELGRVFSLLATCESVTPLLGTLAFAQLYNASLLVFPGLPFAASALFLTPCLFIFSWMLKLPTVSLGGFGRDDNSDLRQLKSFHPDDVTLREEKT